MKMKMKILISLTYFVLLAVVGHTYDDMDIRIIDTALAYFDKRGYFDTLKVSICDFIKLVTILNIRLFLL